MFPPCRCRRITKAFFRVCAILVLAADVEGLVSYVQIFMCFYVLFDEMRRFFVLMCRLFKSVCVCIIYAFRLLILNYNCFINIRN